MSKEEGFGKEEERGEEEEGAETVGEKAGCRLVAFDGLLGIRINIFCFWPHLQFRLLVMKHFASL